MPKLKTQFTGTSEKGDITEAIQEALKAALVVFEEDSAWTMENVGGNKLVLKAPVSVTIRMGGPKGEDATPKPPK
jgi:hypothetical protein